MSDDDFEVFGVLNYECGVDEKVPFLTRPPMVEENLDGDNSESLATEERTTPSKVIENIEEPEELENWPHFPSKLLNTAYFCSKKINK